MTSARPNGSGIGSVIDERIAVSLVFSGLLVAGSFKAIDWILSVPSQDFGPGRGIGSRRRIEDVGDVEVARVTISRSAIVGRVMDVDIHENSGNVAFDGVPRFEVIVRIVIASGGGAVIGHGRSSVIQIGI